MTVLDSFWSKCLNSAFIWLHVRFVNNINATAATAANTLKTQSSTLYSPSVLLRNILLPAEIRKQVTLVPDSMLLYDVYRVQRSGQYTVCELLMPN